ncbi:MAG: hypothetical protein KDD53_03100 [Bdellovibrionales bacterium]|nr:hypothetical protein [Bdellovibrionales bacterium]
MAEVHPYTIKGRLDLCNARLTRLGYDASIGVEGLPAAKHQRASQLIAVQRGLQALAVPSAQREIFGSETDYSAKFISLAGLESHPDSRLEGARLKNHVWASLRQSEGRRPSAELLRFLRFQELFSVDRVVPPFAIDRRSGKVSFPNAKENGSLNIFGTTISPNEIPDKLVEDLKLADLKAFKGDPDGRLMAKGSLEVVLGLKLIFQCARQVLVGRERVLLICEPTASDLALIPEAYRDRVRLPDPSIIGKLLIVRGIPGTTSGRKCSVQFFEDPHKALRSVRYIESGYERENKQLTGILAEVRALNHELDQGYRKGISDQRKADLIGNAEKLLIRCARMLEQSRDYGKIKAQTFLYAARSLRDRLDRLNPSASMTRIAHACKALQDRLEQARSKESHKHTDGRTIFHEISLNEAVVRDFDRKIVAVAKTRDDSSPKTTSLEALGVHRALLDSVTLSPYSVIAEKIARKCEALDKALSSDDRDAEKETFVQIHMLRKFMDLYSMVALQQRWASIALYRIDHAETINTQALFTGLKEMVDALSKEYDPRQIFSEHTVSEAYRAPYYELQQMVRSMRGRFSHYKENPPNLEQLEGILKKFYEFLDGFDIENRVRRLP